MFRLWCVLELRGYEGADSGSLWQHDSIANVILFISDAFSWTFYSSFYRYLPVKCNVHKLISLVASKGVETCIVHWHCTVDDNVGLKI